MIILNYGIKLLTDLSLFKICLFLGIHFNKATKRIEIVWNLPAMKKRRKKFVKSLLWRIYNFLLLINSKWTIVLVEKKFFKSFIFSMSWMTLSLLAKQRKSRHSQWIEKLTVILRLITIKVMHLTRPIVNI